MILASILALCLPCQLYPQGNFITDSLEVLVKRSGYKAAILNALASEYLNISPVRSLELSAEAAKAATKEKNDLEKANAIHNAACALMSQGRYDTCLILLDSVRLLYGRLNNTDGLLRTSNSVANLYFLQGKLDNALELYSDNLLKAQKEKLTAVEISAITNIGRISWLKGRYETALNYYSDALQKADSINHAYMKGMINLLTGIVYQDMGYYELAAERMIAATELFEAMNYLARLPYTYNYLGSVYFELQENEKALTYYRKALESFIHNGDDWGRAVASRYLGRLYRRLQIPDSALYYFRTSLVLAQKLNDRSGQLYSQRFLAEVLLENGESDSARIFFTDNLNRSNASGNIREKVNNLYDLGLLYIREGRYSQAFRFLHEAGTLADSLDLFYENMLISKQLAEAYEHVGDQASALRHYKIFKSLSDTIFSTGKRKNIDELQLRYETDKKNLEISTLKLEQDVQAVRLRNQRAVGYSLAAILVLVLVMIAVLWRSYRQKKRADKEKEILLKEIHHRVKNNLQTISSLLSLQSYNISDTRVRDAVRESQDRVKSMALIHQMLYQQEGLSRIDFGKYLRQLADSIEAGYSKEAKVTCTIECEAAELDIDTAIPLGLIANELIVNAFKYAFNGAKEGNITISLTIQASGKMLFRVRDNGRGMPENFRIDKAETLGLRLVSLLTRQLKGDMTCNSHNGTEFLISF